MAVPQVGALRTTGQQIAEDEGIAMDDFAENEADGAREDRAIEDEGVEFTVFAAGIDAGREIGEESCIDFAAGEAGIEDFGIDANGDRAKACCVEFADEFAGVTFPDGE